MKQAVTKTFTFDAGHRLSNYTGKCRFIHGHTYKLEITVASRVLTNTGFIMDFGDLKEIYKLTVDSLLDHKLMLNRRDELNQSLALMLAIDDYEENVVWFDQNPTVENIARRLYKLLDMAIPSPARLEKLVLFETPTSFTVIER